MSLQDLLAEVGRRADWIPNGAIAAAAFVVAAGLGLAVHGAMMRAVRRMLPTAWIFARTLIDATHRLTRLWDKQVVNLQVVDSNERAVQLRALVSARTSPEAWDLRCEVREKLIVFLQERYPGALPKQRAELVDLADRRRAAAAL